jgi:hypothetical protein
LLREFSGEAQRRIEQLQKKRDDLVTMLGVAAAMVPSDNQIANMHAEKGKIEQVYHDELEVLREELVAQKDKDDAAVAECAELFGEATKWFEERLRTVAEQVSFLFSPPSFLFICSSTII